MTPNTCPSLEFRFDHFPPVVLASEAAVALLSHRQKEDECEKAGVLGGSIRQNGSLLVTHVEPPSPRNKAGKTWVLRDRTDAQQWIDALYVQSNCMSNYVGEWHTHPAIHLSLSGPDKKLLKDLLKTSHLEIDFLVGFVVGMTGSLLCWIQPRKGSLELGRLPLIKWGHISRTTAQEGGD